MTPYPSAYHLHSTNAVINGDGNGRRNKLQPINLVAGKVNQSAHLAELIAHCCCDTKLTPNTIGDSSTHHFFHSGSLLMMTTSNDSIERNSTFGLCRSIYGCLYGRAKGHKIKLGWMKDLSSAYKWPQIGLNDPIGKENPPDKREGNKLGKEVVRPTIAFPTWSNRYSKSTSEWPLKTTFSPGKTPIE